MKTAKSEFKSAPRYIRPIAAFINKQSIISKTLPNAYHYRKPVIKRAGKFLLIEYYYRIPVDLRQLYNNKEWHRFRIREDINRRGNDKEQYAEWLRNEIEDSLKRGYNPFNTDAENKFLEEGIVEEKTELNATDAMLLFLETWNKRGLEKHTMEIYTKVVNRFLEWLVRKHIPYTEIKNITQAHIEGFLNDMKKDHGFGNREYNNHRSFLRTAFIFLLQKKHITDNPFVGIGKMKAPVTKHRYFDKKTLDDINKVLNLRDPYTLFAGQTVYYLCVRSEKEMKHLKVGNIFWEQSKVLAEITKGKVERYIPLDENFKEILLKHDIDKYPADHYIFGISGMPAAKPFGKGFFSKRFRKICNEIDLSSAYTIYSYKHTRVVNLKQDGVSDADIMSLTGHLDYTSFAKYLRDLGLTADIKNINAKSRKI